MKKNKAPLNNNVHLKLAKECEPQGDCLILFPIQHIIPFFLWLMTDLCTNTLEQSVHTEKRVQIYSMSRIINCKIYQSQQLRQNDIFKVTVNTLAADIRATSLFTYPENEGLNFYDLRHVKWIRYVSPGSMRQKNEFHFFWKGLDLRLHTCLEMTYA